MIVWIQCTSQGKPIFCTASSDKLRSRGLLRLYLYPGEDITWAEIRAEGSIEKQFEVKEVKHPSLELYRMAGKIGPWARRGAKGVRYLATGPQGQPVYRRILSAEKEGDTWHYVRVRLEGEDDVLSCWCGTNTYEEA